MLLITNSHFGGLYPTGFSSLATGGTIGNALFMFCSGYALYFSLMKAKKSEIVKSKIRKFSDWYLKRVLRIFPSVWLFRVFQVLALGVTFQWTMVYLPGYWFLNAIIVFYVLFYFVILYAETRLPHVIIFLLIPFLILFFTQPNFSTEFIIEQTGHPYKIHWFYYFSIMLFGAYIGQHNELFVKIPKNGGGEIIDLYRSLLWLKGLSNSFWNIWFSVSNPVDVVSDNEIFCRFKHINNQFTSIQKSRETNCVFIEYNFRCVHFAIFYNWLYAKVSIPNRIYTRMGFNSY